jgi:hypothetical protein
MAAPAPEVTALLAALESGDEGAMNQLVPLVYEELRRLARRHLITNANLTTTPALHQIIVQVQLAL